MAKNSDSAKKALKPGDAVSWTSSGGESVGKVVKKLTSPIKIKGHEVAASADNPEYLVRSDASGGLAAHKPASLKKPVSPKKPASAKERG